MIQSWQCTEIASGTNCVVVSTTTQATRSYDPDTVMILAMILSILSIFLWQYIFKPFISSK